MNYYLTTENKKILQNTINKLMIEQTATNDINIIKSNQKYANYLSCYTNISNDIINIICQYTNDLFTILIQSDIDSDIPVDLRIFFNIKILDICIVDITYFFINKYDIYISNNISSKILISAYHLDNFPLQYFFNAYMKQQYNYDNYFNTYNDKYNSCICTNENEYTHIKLPNKDIYEFQQRQCILHVKDNEIMTDIIMIIKTLIDELQIMIK